MEVGITAQYAYRFLMRTEGLGVLETVPQHVARCRGLGLDDNIGGPFEASSRFVPKETAKPKRPRRLLTRRGVGEGLLAQAFVA